MERKVAFVTGASRGIGRAAAIALAAKGFDVVVTARTLREGESADGRPLAGSLETTARAIRDLGREALEIRLDLLDPATIDAALSRTFWEWGRVDVLLNNGVYTGPGSLECFLDTQLATVETMFRANVFSPTYLTQRVLPSMCDRGNGTVINMVSAAGMMDPPAPAGAGGWGFGYGATKAALLRMVGVLRVEHADSGIHFYNVEPGFVITEAMKLADPEGKLMARYPSAPPEVPGAVVAWLASDPAAVEWNGQTVAAQTLALELGIHPPWRDSPTGASE